MSNEKLSQMTVNCEMLLENIWKSDSGEIPKSATDLLEEFGVGISAREFNNKMMDNNYMEIKTRKDSNDKEKEYKVLTQKGQGYGINFWDIVHNSKETRPLYFIHRFPELINKLGFIINLK